MKGIKPRFMGLPPKESFGRVVFEEVQVNGESALYITGIQSSPGFHSLPPELKVKYGVWKAVLLRLILEAAHKAGYGHVYVKSAATVREEHPGKRGGELRSITDASLKHHYIDLFENWWEEVTLAAGLYEMSFWHLDLTAANFEELMNKRLPQIARAEVRRAGWPGTPPSLRRLAARAEVREGKEAERQRGKDAKRGEALSGVGASRVFVPTNQGKSERRPSSGGQLLPDKRQVDLGQLPSERSPLTFKNEDTNNTYADKNTSPHEVNQPLPAENHGGKDYSDQGEKKTINILAPLRGQSEHGRKSSIGYIKSQELISYRSNPALSDPEVIAEVKHLSGEKIRTETAFELGRVVGAFNPRYSRDTLVAMLRALRVARGQMRQELIPVYLKEILETFRAQGIPLEARSREVGAEILLYDHVPSESEIAALVFSLAMNPNPGIPAEVVIDPNQALTPQALSRLNQYQARLKNLKDVDGNPIQINFFHSTDHRKIREHLQKATSRLTARLTKRAADRFGESAQENRLLIRSHIVVTMAEDLARRLETEDATLLFPLYGMKQVRYSKPETSSHYSALQSAALSLSKRDYESLQEFDRLLLERQTPSLYTSRYDRIPENWHEAWLLAEARLLTALTQAA